MDDKTFLSQVKGFTPVIDVLAEELGTMAALVYGIVWRYCQMEDKACRASIQAIATHANISPRTVQRHLRTLVKKDYLEDLSPQRKNAPHSYRDTGKLQIIGLVEARLVSNTERVDSEVGMTESQTRYDRESDLGMTESHTKRVSKKEQQGEKDSMNELDEFFGEEIQNPMAGLPRAVDNHQLTIDQASGGKAENPTHTIASHLFQGFMGGPVPLPKKPELNKWIEASKRLVSLLTNEWHVPDLCYAIDDWWSRPDLCNFWKDMPCKPETMRLIARHYQTCQGRVTSSPVDIALPHFSVPTVEEIAWEAALPELTSYKVHLNGVQPLYANDAEFVLSVPDENRCVWLNERLAARIADILEVEQVRFLVIDDVRRHDEKDLVVGEVERQAVP